MCINDEVVVGAPSRDEGSQVPMKVPLSFSVRYWTFRRSLLKFTILRNYSLPECFSLATRFIATFATR